MVSFGYEITIVLSFFLTTLMFVVIIEKKNILYICHRFDKEIYVVIVILVRNFSWTTLINYCMSVTWIFDVYNIYILVLGRRTMASWWVRKID